MRDVIFMSNRNSPAGSWYDQVIAAAQAVNFDAPFPGSVGGPQFLADFSDPDFTSDLYMVDVRTRALRQLTDFHNVIPEFDWNRGYTKLLWTALVDRKYSLTQVGTFPSIGAAERDTPPADPGTRPLRQTDQDEPGDSHLKRTRDSASARAADAAIQGHAHAPAGRRDLRDPVAAATPAARRRVQRGHRGTGLRTSP